MVPPPRAPGRTPPSTRRSRSPRSGPRTDRSTSSSAARSWRPCRSRSGTGRRLHPGARRAAGARRVPLPRAVRRRRVGVVRDVQRHAERPLRRLVHGLPRLRLPHRRRRGLGRRGRRLHVDGPGPRPHERRRPVQPARRGRLQRRVGRLRRRHARRLGRALRASRRGGAAGPRDAGPRGRREDRSSASARACPRARRCRTRSRTTTSRATAPASRSPSCGAPSRPRP